MSMELFVCSDIRLTSIAEWQAAIAAEGYPLVLSADIPFLELNGFFPSILSGQATGFECSHANGHEFVRENVGVEFDHEWKYVLGLRWRGGDLVECRAAWMAGTAYARATDGVIYNDQDDECCKADRAREIVELYLSPDLEAELNAVRQSK